jgi:glucokinase
MISPSTDECFIGIDLGGTSVSVGFVTPTGKILHCEESATDRAKGPEHVVRIIGSMARKLKNNSGLTPSAAGIGAPGPLDTRTGVISEMPNFDWSNVPLCDMLRRELGIPVYLENDANAAAFGEYRAGAGAGSRCLVCLTLGTGIGGGLVIDGNVFRGVSDAAAEFGHMIVEIDGRACGCGKRGCLERYASATAVAGRAVERLGAGEPSMLYDMTGGKVSLVSAEMVARAAGEGDRLAAEVITEAVSYLAVGVSNLLNILNPDVVVIGGGLSGAGDLIMEPLRIRTEELSFRVQNDVVRIIPSALGRHAGVIGSALLALARMTED